MTDTWIETFRIEGFKSSSGIESSGFGFGIEKIETLRLDPKPLDDVDILSSRCRVVNHSLKTAAPGRGTTWLFLLSVGPLRSRLLLTSMTLMRQSQHAKKRYLK